MSFTRITLALAALLSAACATRPVPLRIAAAADLRFALDEVVKTYQPTSARRADRAAYGSSGMFYAQLIEPRALRPVPLGGRAIPAQAGQARTDPAGERIHLCRRTHRAVDRQRASGIDVEHLGMEALRQPAVRHIAIANPAHAPYGRAAEAALRSLGVYDAVKDKLVMGENISQAFQMVQSGAAEVGHRGALAGDGARLPPARAATGKCRSTAYPRMEQGGVILRWTQNPEAARAFRAFLLAPEGRAILKRYGFSGE